jgi:hypothetical protein
VPFQKSSCAQLVSSFTPVLFGGVDSAAMEPVSLMDRPVELRHDDDEEFADEASQEEYGSDEEHSQTDESDQSGHESQDQVI